MSEFRWVLIARGEDEYGPESSGQIVSFFGSRVGAEHAAARKRSHLRRRFGALRSAGRVKVAYTDLPLGSFVAWGSPGR